MVLALSAGSPTLAYATLYRVDLVDPQFNEIEGVDVEISFWNDATNLWGPWEDTDEDIAGSYFHDRPEGMATHWRVRFNDIGYVADAPNTNPCYPNDLLIRFTWTLVEVR